MHSTLANKKLPTVILTGGGTAGHVWPHFAIANETTSPLSVLIKENKIQILYLASKNGMERKIIETNAPQWQYFAIATGKLRRYFSWRNFIDPLLVILGFLQAFFIISKYKNAVLFSKGGFVSAPVVWAAWLCRIPVVIHESDLSLALATKLTVPFADKILVSFEETKNQIPNKYLAKLEVTGIPLRASLFSASKETSYSVFSLDENKKTILIFGGSLGADSLNNKIIEAVPELSTQYNIIHIVGKNKTLSVKANSNYKQYEFLTNEMSNAYVISDLAICRAGASSIFELAAARIPMILVPLGLHQSRGDQIENAKSFERKGWAQILWEKDMHKESVLALVNQAMQSLIESKKALQTAPTADAAQRVASILLSFLKL